MEHKDYRQDEIQDAASLYVGEDFHERSRADFVAGAGWADEHPKKGMVNIDNVCQFIAMEMSCGMKYTCQTKSKFIKSIRDEFKR